MGAATEAALMRDPGTAARAVRITFVITGLTTGGAEMMLWKLISRMDRRRFAPSIIALSARTPAMLPTFQQLGVPCELLGWRPADAVIGMRRLARMVRASEPDIVQGWMYHGNIAATLATRLAGLRVPVVWNIRATLMERRHEKRLTWLLIWLGAKLSFSPVAIINNSSASAAEHEQRMGYRPDKRVILPNGFDTELFAPSAGARLALRASLGLPGDAVVAGLLARYHPMKGHDIFVAAAAEVCRLHDVHFVIAGDGAVASNVALSSAIEKFGLAGRIHLLGRRSDVPAVVAALDVLVCPSTSGEGFPNVVGEAMSCGVTCVVTDVGDSAAVIGETGITVPPGDLDALAAGIVKLVDIGPAGRAELGARARRRAIERFSLDAVVSQYEALYTRIHEEQRSS